MKQTDRATELYDALKQTVKAFTCESIASLKRHDIESYTSTEEQKRAVRCAIELLKKYDPNFIISIRQHPNPEINMVSFFDKISDHRKVLGMTKTSLFLDTESKRITIKTPKWGDFKEYGRFLTNFGVRYSSNM